MHPSSKELSFLEPEAVKKLLQKVDDLRKVEDLKTITFKRLYSHLSVKEKELIKKFLDLTPTQYGFRGKYLGIVPVPRDIVAIKKQKYIFRNKQQTVSVQYLPKTIYLAYQKLNRAVKKDLGRPLLIDSGYRSPANQVLVFFYYLSLHNFDFIRTVKRVAFPGYSEHGAPHRQAIDFLTVKGVPSDAHPLAFEKTQEYRWLQKNAHRFGFFLSYPKNNPDGIMYEPWHWHFEDA